MRYVSIILMLSCGVLAADDRIDVFYLGGQSNATHDWRSGVELELREAYGDQLFVIIHAFHPGQWLKKWITQEPQGLFHEDFYNTEGTGALEVEWAKLLAEGKTPVLRGFFWLQGEGDTGNFDDQAVYAERFNRMRTLVAEKFEQAEPPPFVVAVIDGNEDPKYDDPEQAAGRTREKIEGMRQVLFSLGEQEDGAAFDTRGFERTDLWHLTPKAQKEVGKAMGQLWLERFYFEPK